MYLKESTNGHLVEVLELSDLFDPFQTTIKGRLHYGEEIQEPETFAKSDLVFLSNESLPRCWLDPHYRDADKG
ncbi:acetyltransferase [Kangiella shandongensis]|uniref:acetyltransferase n=1 Tax=Kangiella shandongensis TaxID=2763258 RepID=UPI001CBF1960|nr:acetyltransferase [Kangiella shandongensis]